jgi:hypothetical protein
MGRHGAKSGSLTPYRTFREMLNALRRRARLS